MSEINPPSRLANDIFEISQLPWFSDIIHMAIFDETFGVVVARRHRHLQTWDHIRWYPYHHSPPIEFSKPKKSSEISNLFSSKK